MTRFQINLNATDATSRINAEQALLRGFEEVFAVNRDELAAGTTTFRDLAEAEIDFCIANPENWGATSYDENYNVVPFVDDRDRAVALVLGDLIRRAKNDDTFLYQYASAHDLFDHVGEDVGNINLRIARFEGDWFLLENSEYETTATIYESRYEALAAHRERVEELDPFHPVVRLNDDSENRFFWNEAKARERLAALNSEEGNDFTLDTMPIRDLTEGWGDVDIEDED